jgi:hypothetical protein
MRRGGIAIAALLALGCQSRLSAASACTFTSECADDLLCAGGVCRAECVEDRDCASGSSCSRFGGASGVCVPPSTPRPCQLQSDCGNGAHCRSGACRSDCRIDADCEGFGQCVDASCSMPITTQPAPDGGVTLTCGTGEVACGLRCISVLTDEEHCGACDVACAPGDQCMTGVCTSCPDGGCPTPGDTCEDAITLAPVPGMPIVLGDDPAAFSTSSLSCLVGASDRYFALDMTERSIVHFHAAAGNGLGVLGDGCASIAATCTPDSCGVTDFDGFEIVDAGRHLFVEDVANLHDLSIVSVDIGDAPVEDLPAPPFDRSGTFGATLGTTSCQGVVARVGWYAIAPCHSFTPPPLTTCGSDPGVHLIVDNGEREVCAAADDACTGAETVQLQNTTRLVVVWVVGQPGQHWELHGM